MTLKPAQGQAAHADRLVCSCKEAAAAARLGCSRGCVPAVEGRSWGEAASWQLPGLGLKALAARLLWLW